MSVLDTMDQSDSGGVGAKKGFFYQDLAAAFYLTQMLIDKTLKYVRCEVTDDIDLVYEVTRNGLLPSYVKRRTLLKMTQ